MDNRERDKPTAESKYKDIHIVEDKYLFSKKEWKFQKYGRILLVLLLIGGLLGLFGGGVLSKKTVHGNDFKIEYYSLAREETSAKLYIYLQNPSDITSISFNSSYLEDVRVLQTVPAPENSKTADNRIFYLFNTASSGVIIFYLSAGNAGFKELSLGIDNEIKRLKQFIYF